MSETNMINIIRKLGNLQDKSANITKLATRANNNTQELLSALRLVTNFLQTLDKGRGKISDIITKELAKADETSKVNLEAIERILSDGPSEEDVKIAIQKSKDAMAQASDTDTETNETFVAPATFGGRKKRGGFRYGITPSRKKSSITRGQRIIKTTTKKRKRSPKTRKSK